MSTVINLFLPPKNTLQPIEINERIDFKINNQHFYRSEKPRTNLHRIFEYQSVGNTGKQTVFLHVKSILFFLTVALTQLS